MIRHCVEENNIDDNMVVIDPKKARHVAVSNGKILSMSGLVDPTTHLNLDFPDHRIAECIVTEAFKVGAKIRTSEYGLEFATVSDDCFAHYGSVDYTQRLFDMIESVKKYRESKFDSTKKIIRVNTTTRRKKRGNKG
jgi:hypothetical protein